MTALGRLAGLIVCGYPSWSGLARADAVADWNAIALQAPRPGPSGILDLAMVHAALIGCIFTGD